MSYSEKLQRAVELTISAGYQLSKEAFDFLNEAATTEDPVEIINKVLEKVENLRDKPLFIERSLLEGLVKKPEVLEEIFPKPKVEQLAKPQEQQQPQMLEGKKLFRPYAKEVEPNISVIENFGGNLSSSGTMEDYLKYFQDRFKRIEKLLRHRIDVRSATSVIDALKAPPNTKLKIIGMIAEKREQKQKVFLTIEDLTASVTVLVPQNAPLDLLNKAKMLLPDQVICASVTKTRSNLLVAEDIVLPDVAQRTQNRASVPVYAVLTSDMHVGSIKFQKEAFKRFILWLNGRYGNEEMREIASQVKYVLIAGDIVDGIGVYPNQVKELSVKDIYGQYKLAAKIIEQIPEYMEVIIIPGNHDAPRKALPQPPISDAFLEMLQESRKVHSLGNPCLLSLHKVEILMYHGRSLDDIISTVPGINYTQPEKAMTLLLQSRHLAPVYGEKTPLAPESRDFLVIERVPDIFHAGHIHTLGHTNYKGVLVINSGCWQAQTEYMKRLGVVPMPGLVPVVNLQTLDIKVLSFT
ncbi:MAG: DNA-directed DNA polymerase II small subunit [Nitrososphaerota archaeon]|nr:DNA-directed DNA polymerase II small subunit [Candidatus Bathyarchaeota archaeon]MDW8023780.1 DNA-directed DNA polymerase II small subunit [Nitrososphaerota archaeon]